MAISNETMLSKMMEELQKASKSVEDQAVMIDHISKVKLLCELLLDEQQKVKGQNINDVKHNETIMMDKKSTSTIVLEEDKDGTSIFDF